MGREISHQAVREEGRNKIFVGGESKVESVYTPGAGGAVVQYDTSFWEIECDMQDGKGDGTVPASSGKAPRRDGAGPIRQQFRFQGFSHEPAYKDPTAQRVTHYAITKNSRVGPAMKLIATLVFTLLILMTAGCDVGKKDHIAQHNMNHVMKTHCIGRTLIDLPDGYALKSGSLGTFIPDQNEVEDGNIDLLARPATDVASFERQVKQRNAEWRCCINPAVALADVYAQQPVPQSC